MIRRALLVIVLGVLAGCTIRADEQPRAIPGEEGQVAVIGASSAADASGAERIYLVGPGDNLLRAVPRTANSRDDLIKILFLGPTGDELAGQYSTAIPSDTALLSASPQGQLLVLDVSDDLTRVTGDSLNQALAQIVYTATELDGIETVQIKVDGAKVGWLTPAGETKTVLRTYDFPTAVATAQPDYPALGSGV